MNGATDNFSATCFGCGRLIKIRNGRERWHGCRLRWLSRVRWAGHKQGWHSGYRFAAENPDDPMVQRDGEDYGTGWAGHMWGGGVLIVDKGADRG